MMVSSGAAAQSQTRAHAPAEAMDDNARYAWLDAELTQISASTERWYTGWTATFAWVAVGQYSFAATAPNSGLREVSIVGALNSTLGLGAMLIAPNTLNGTLERLHQFDASSPLGAWERRRRAEYLLHATAAEESFYHSPIPLVLAAISSGVGAFVLIRSYDQVVGGWATLGSGVGVTLLQMITRPFSAGNAWERYKNKYNPSPGSQVPPDQIHLSFGVTPTGAAVSGTF
ncbi:MAG TPA: hypothetical protein VK762_25985 [Polyangiaceae bacterium]|nr:hypothetical protein [Polyangiaceae bacterium]